MHVLYCQVQTQLLVTNSKKCHFVVWTNACFAVLCVKRDVAYCQKVMDKIQTFVELQLIPELLTRKLKFSMDAMESECIDDGKTYCKCPRPAFGKIIVCSKDDCVTEKYHYECFGLKRKPRHCWYCLQCQND